MGQYNEMIITNEGLSLLAKAQLEAGSMIFTSVKTGNGTYNGSEDLRSEISLKSVKNSFQVSSVEQEDSSKLKLRCLLSNDEVSIGYDISEIGVYGKIDQSEEEKMIGIATAVKPDFFPSHDVSPSSILFEIYIKIANCSNVNFEYTIPEGVYELAQNAEEKYKKLAEHIADKNNPHNVTAEGIGAASVTHTHDDRYYTESEIDTKLNGKLNTTLRGSANGLAELDATGKVPSTQLPSFVDDVIEGYLSGGKFYMESAHTTQITGESGKIYIDLSTEKTYRWSGSAFVVISDTIALGETSATAYRGDRGKTAYDHSQAAHARTDATKTEKSATNGNIKINGAETIVYTHPGSGTNPHGTTKSDIGLSNVGNFKAVSTVSGQGLTDTEKANARSNIGAGTADVDSALSSTSTNPVQNKVVAAALDGKMPVYSHNGGTFDADDLTSPAIHLISSGGTNLPASCSGGVLLVDGSPQTTQYFFPLYNGDNRIHTRYKYHGTKWMDWEILGLSTSQSTAITTAGTYALDAVQNNASVSGTLANRIKAVEDTVGKVYSKTETVYGSGAWKMSGGLTVPAGTYIITRKGTNINGAGVSLGCGYNALSFVTTPADASTGIYTDIVTYTDSSNSIYIYYCAALNSTINLEIKAVRIK